MVRELIEQSAFQDSVRFQIRGGDGILVSLVADLEAALGPRLLFIDLHPLHPSVARSTAAPGDHLLDSEVIPLEDGLDAAIVEIAHPAAQSGVSRLLDGRAAEIDALNPAVDDHPAADREAQSPPGA